MIKFEDIVFRYNNETPIFDKFSWQVNAGETWAIIGPSGCGKSTLLYLAAGLRQPSDGRVLVNGQTLQRPRPETGLILQDYGLLPWATIRENVQLGLRVRRFYGPDGTHAPQDYDPAYAESRVEAWLDRLGILEQADKYPGQVSGGQRQRTAIGRTLVLEPDLLLMDEPFSSLDVPTREDLQNVVMNLQHETGVAIVLVTHNIEEAVFLGRRILVLTEPPTHKPLIVDNSQAATPEYRNSLAYLEQCNHVRRLMGLGD
jgi:ABC-type nitrate/sulfonate/bicarbonate transport system ATPase subunit